ncbi:MAG: hypothetical protein QM731_24635 [Chitinophagaceae bacterium]
MQYWNYIIIALCLLLLAFLLWKEVKRDNKARLTARIIATCITLAALACLALPISYSKTVSADNNNSAILITDGYNADSLKAFQRTSPGIKTYTLQQYITSAPSVQQLHVFGYGLSAAQWQQLPAVSVIPHIAETPAGIIAVDWQKSLSQGQTLYLQGTYNNSTAKNTRLVFTGFNTVLDSVTIPAHRQASFTLKTIPRHAGMAVYRLLTLDGTDTLSNEPVPIEVFPNHSFSVLFLASAPGFENRFLANWLAQNGYAVAMRTTISKDKYEQSFLNAPRIALEYLTPALLEKFDLVLNDPGTLQALNATELNNLRKQVELNGTGLVMKADSAANKTAFYNNDFPLTVVKDSTRQQVALQLSGNNIATAPLIVEQPVYIRYQAGSQPLVQDKQGHIYAAAALLGTGKLVLTTLEKSYSWALSGNTVDYQRLWTLLLQKAVRKTAVNAGWRTEQQLPLAYEPVQLYIETSTATPRIRIENTDIALSQNALAGNEWAATYWPQKAGWQTVVINTNDTCRWYAFPSRSWQSVNALSRINATGNYINSTVKQSDKEIEQTTNNSRIPVSKAWFFILFLLGCAFLWIERKI